MNPQQASAMPSKADLDKALKDLAATDWQSWSRPAETIVAAINASHADAAARKDVERRLIAAAGAGMHPAPTQFVCRRLSEIGTDEAAPVFASLLARKEVWPMGCFGLERMATPAARKALRDAVGRAAGDVKAGIIASLGRCRDAESVALLIPLLSAAESNVVLASISALGRIGTAEAAAALVSLRSKAPKVAEPLLSNACLEAAERLSAEGKKAEAAKVYRALSAADAPRHVRAAAARGLIASEAKGNPN
jgi:HEAT repeat protein